jgi:CO dehydrogenase/acetyl-CoA synthase beta subunit
MKNIEKEEKKKIFKAALDIVDKLSSLEIEDEDLLEDLIDRAKKVKKNRFWRL